MLIESVIITKYNAKKTGAIKKLERAIMSYQIEEQSVLTSIENKNDPFESPLPAF